MRRYVRVIFSLAVLSAIGSAGRLAGQDAAGPSNSDDVQDLIIFTDSRPLLVRMHVKTDGKPFRQVWRDNLIRVFGELDRDLDGVLNKDEASRVPDLDGVDPRFRLANPRATVTPLVADAAGNVSRETYLDHCAKSDAAAFSTRVGQGQSQLSTALFALLDANQDQRLSAAELRAAETSLRRRDYDDDEIITDGEILPGQNSFGAIGLDRAIVAPTGRSPFVLVINPSSRTTELADALLARYDANKDGKLNVAAGDSPELRLDAESLAHLDRDADQSLSRDELARYGEQKPDVELQYEVGASATKMEPVRLNPVFSGESPPMPRAELKYVVNTGDDSLEFRRADQPAGMARQFAVGQIPFQNLDSDNNGYLDENEARRFQFIGISFKAMDRDGDGKVFKEEFEAYNQRQNAAAATRVALEVTDDGRQLLELIDKDRDNRITLRELRAAAEVLEKSDTDRDGALGGSEIPRRLRFELTRGTANSALGRQVVAFGGARQPTVRPNAASAGVSWFRRMDRNRDGDLSPREFLGPRNDFERLDANHDGLIDAKEAESAANN